MQQQFRGLFGKLVLAALCVWPALSHVHAKPQLVYDQSGVESIYDSTLYQEVSDTYRTDGDSTKSKLLASILAFPLPFGMLGLHRIYLGAKPIIPILYLVTFGGIVGILPFIDMMVLILSKDIKPFVDSSNILFWYKKTE
jgi:TM2 domain-containing membrane protein YozV